MREIDAWVIFLVFHGNDLHTGFEPITNKLTEEQLDHLDQAYNMAGEPNRINIISYPSWAAASRIGKVAVSPSPHFGNEGAIAPFKARQLNFSEHGHHLFMNEHARANRLGREFFFAFYNSLQYGGLTLRMEVNDLLQHITYVDEDKQDIPLDALPRQIDIVHNATTVALWRGYWAWYQAQSFISLIRIRKVQFQNMRKQLELGQPTKLADMVRSEINVLPTSPNGLSEPAEHIIQQVLGHKKVDGKVCLLHLKIGNNSLSLSPPLLDHVDNPDRWR